MGEEQAFARVPFIRRFFQAVLAFAFVVSGWAGFIPSALAATLYVSPASGSYRVGQTFSVGIYVTSTDQSTNAYNGVVEYPEDIIQITSINKTGVTSLWVQDPSYSNGRGTASFEGVVLNPGFTGSAGKIITITFKALKAGAAPVRLVEGAVLANDGQGTNILSGTGQATFTITDAGTPAPTPSSPAPSAPAAGVPNAPKVASSTHPDPDQWYNNKNPAFSWSLPGGVTGVNVLADRDANKDPGTRSDGLFSTYDYKDVEDGTWYFHIRLQNANGWGGTSHFRFQIDTVPPSSPVVQESQGTIRLSATDALSGVARFDLSVDGAAPKPVSATDGEASVPVPALDPGEHTVSVRAVDRAGNASSETKLVLRVAALDPPRLTDVPDLVYTDESVRGSGTTVPSGVVTVRLVPAGEDPLTFDVQADDRGSFSFVAPKRLASGTYALSARVRDPGGRESAWTTDMTVRVRERPTFNWLLFTLFLLLATLLAILCLILAGDRRKEKNQGDKLLRKFQELQETVHEAFDALREDTQKQLKLMERAKNKRELTAEEEKITRHLRRTLDWSEKLIEQEVEEARSLARKQKRSK